MAKKDNLTPKKCKKCIYKHSCQEGPSSCGYYDEVESATVDEKVAARKEYHKFLKKLEKERNKK